MVIKKIENWRPAKMSIGAWIGVIKNSRKTEAEEEKISETCCKIFEQ